MSQIFSRRHFIGAGGAIALGPLANNSATITAAPVQLKTEIPAGPLVVYFTPIRVFDSRKPNAELSGAKLRSGESVAVTLPAEIEGGGFAIAMFINLTITQTEGSGYLVIHGSDLSGERPFPETSDINWSTAGQTLANLVLPRTGGGQNAIEVHAGAWAALTSLLMYKGMCRIRPNERDR